jgi:hypothetical protein
LLRDRDRHLVVSFLDTEVPGETAAPTQPLHNGARALEQPALPRVIKE